MRPTLPRFVGALCRTATTRMIFTWPVSFFFDTATDTRQLKTRCRSTTNLMAVNIVTFHVPNGMNGMA
jgi:hypothetical protein